MKTSIIMAVVLSTCIVHNSYAMWGRQVVQPTNFNFSAGKVTAPKFEKFDAVPKSMVTQKSLPDVKLNEVLVDSSTAHNDVQSTVSAARSIYGLNKPVLFVPKDVKAQDSYQVSAIEQSSGVENSSIPLHESLSVQAAQAAPAELQSSADVAAVPDVAVSNVKPVSKPSFLDAIKGRKVDSVKKDVFDQNTSQQQIQERIEFKTLDEYQKALYNVEVQAEEQALKPINRQATELFNQQWPDILSKYTADRQSLGQTIVQERVDLLKNQTKNKISQDLISKNKDVIAQAVQKAVEDFKVRAVKPEKVVRSSQIKTSVKPFTPVVTEGSIRSQAENQMRDSIIKPMIDAKFTPEFESVWVQDYALDYEMKHNAQASVKVIDAAKKEYVDKLRLDAYKELTAENKAAIKQAGNDAVAQWKLQKEAQVQQASTSAQAVVSVKDVEVKLDRPSSPVTVAVDSRPATPVSF